MSARALCREYQARRRDMIVAAYLAGHSSRVVARMFATSSGHVRDVVKKRGVARPVGRPRTA